MSRIDLYVWETEVQRLVEAMEGYGTVTAKPTQRHAVQRATVRWSQHGIGAHVLTALSKAQRVTTLPHADDCACGVCPGHGGAAPLYGKRGRVRSSKEVR